MNTNVCTHHPFSCAQFRLASANLQEALDGLTHPTPWQAENKTPEEWMSSVVCCQIKFESSRQVYKMDLKIETDIDIAIEMKCGRKHP